MYDKVIAFPDLDDHPALPALDAGDFVPHFVCGDIDLEFYSGRQIVLAWLVDQRLHQTLHDLRHDGRPDLRVIALTPDPALMPERAWNLHPAHCEDEELRATLGFGLTNVVLVCDPNGKIRRRHLDTVDLATLRGEVFRFARNDTPPPIMRVPQVIGPTLCDALLDYWRDRPQQPSKVGSRVDPRRKIRSDVSVGDAALTTRLDRKLARSLFPEIRKVGRCLITHREPYKIGGYGTGGFYDQHRDTWYPYLYRRFSISIGLNDTFEGGGIAFPEYDDVSYHPPGRGGALVFPSTLRHYVRPVTAGLRAVLVTFAFGDVEARFKADSTGLSIERCALSCPPVAPGVPQSTSCEHPDWVDLERDPSD